MTQIFGDMRESEIFRPRSSRVVVLIQWCILAILIASAVWLRGIYGTNTDVSWLLSTGERVLAGERLYIDLIEVNPPASVYLYLPALLLARAFGLQAEWLVDLLVFAAMAASLWYCWRMLKRAPGIKTLTSAPFALLAVYVLAVMPAETFAQREHIATILLLPWMALAVARIEGAPVVLRDALFAGVCGAMVFCIKPIFAAALALCVLPVFWRSLKWRYFLLLENLTGFIISAAYMVLIAVQHPAFFSQIMPVLDVIYIPLQAFSLAYTKPWFAMWALLSLATIWSALRCGFCSSPIVLLLASTGFALTCLWQGKFWPYHYYPMFACAVLACASAGLMQFEQTRREGNAAGGVARLMRAGFLHLALIALCLPRLWPLFGPMENTSALAQAIEQSGGKGASVLALSSDISLGHPAVRQAGAKWVGSFGSLWVQNHVAIIRARFRPDAATQARLNDIENWHAGFLLSDLRDKRPAIILVEKESVDMQQWAMSRSEIAAELAHYHKVQELCMPSRRTHVSILVRQRPAP